jgi:threonine/homoserine/homoserine lactone efflux protein
MIDPTLFLAFIAAVTLLMLMPGPNVALIVANSVAYGISRGLLTVVGTSAAMIVQLAVFALGLAGLLDLLGTWFEWLRWLGVAYLLYLGIAHWRATPVDLTMIKPQPKSARAIMARALLVSLTNPKTLLFYSAFFPQFIASDRAIGPQVVILSLAFVAIALLVDSSWAILAGKARGLLARHGRLRNRISGGLLATAGLCLALSRAK